MPVGEDWERLRQEEELRQVLAEIFGVPHDSGRFVETVEVLLRLGSWHPEAPERAAKYVKTYRWILSIFDSRRIPSWEDLAAQLAEDPDFIKFVKRAARTRLERADYDEKLLARASVEECYITVIQKSGNWYKQRRNKYGEFHRTWIKLLEVSTSKHYVTRIANELNGDHATAGERGRMYRPDRATGGEEVPDRESRELSPDEMAEMSEQVERLNKCIEALPRLLRLVIEGRRNGETFKEIAQRLHVRLGYVLRYYKKAVRELRLCMGGEE